MDENTQTYAVLRPVNHDLTDYLPGETLELDERTAAPLLDIEAITVIARDADAQEDVLDRAIAALDPDDPEHWTQGGLPQVAALGREAGFEVTAAMRDVAWVRYQQARQTDGG